MRWIWINVIGIIILQINKSCYLNGNQIVMPFKEQLFFIGLTDYVSNPFLVGNLAKSKKMMQEITLGS